MTAELWPKNSPTRSPSSSAYIVRFGEQPVSIVGGVRYWVDPPNTAPNGFGGPARDDLPVSGAMIDSREWLIVK
jgi:hypothetical protein